MPPSTPGPMSFWLIPTKRHAARFRRPKPTTSMSSRPTPIRLAWRQSAILGSVLYDYGALEKQMVLNAVAGKLEEGKAYYMGMADGFGGWAPNPAMKTVIPPRRKPNLIPSSPTSGRVG